MFFKKSPVPYRPHLPSWRQPLYLHLRPLWLALEERLASVSGRVLDIGCGLQPYRALMCPLVQEYVGLDRLGPLSNPTVVGNAESIPFERASFDFVVATQVFEHLARPELALQEVVRVLRPGGRLIVTVPGVWPTHEAPHDYWRFTRHGLQSFIEGQALICERQVALGGTWATIGQMINLEISALRVVRQLVPFINIVAATLDLVGAREDLVLNWFIEAKKPPSELASS